MYGFIFVVCDNLNLWFRYLRFQTEHKGIEHRLMQYHSRRLCLMSLKLKECSRQEEKSEQNRPRATED